MKLLEQCNVCGKIVSVAHAAILAKLPVYCQTCLRNGNAQKHHKDNLQAAVKAQTFFAEPAKIKLERPLRKAPVDSETPGDKVAFTALLLQARVFLQAGALESFVLKFTSDGWELHSKRPGEKTRKAKGTT